MASPLYVVVMLAGAALPFLRPVTGGIAVVGGKLYGAVLRRTPRLYIFEAFDWNQWIQISVVLDDLSCLLLAFLSKRWDGPEQSILNVARKQSQDCNQGLRPMPMQFCRRWSWWSVVGI